MAATLMDGSKATILTGILAAEPFTDLVMLLIAADITPTEDMTFFDLPQPNPAVSIGYGNRTVENWETPLLQGDGTAFSSADMITYTNTSPTVAWEEVWGWFWFNGITGALVMAARFPTSFILPPLTSRRWVPAILLGQLATA